MGRRLLVQVVAAAVALVFAIAIWSTGEALRFDWLRFFSAAVLVALLVLSLWDHWLWRISVMQRLPRVPRDIRGTWRGTLDSLWVNPETGESPGAKTAYLVVRQSASSLSVILLTDESTSASTVAHIMSDGGVWHLEYIYRSRPRARVEHRSRMHHGSVFLTIVGRPAARVHGHYWTDRNSRGELDFTERRFSVVDDLISAETLFVHTSSHRADVH